MKTTYNKRIVSLKPSSIAMLQGVFGAVAGLAVAILFSLNTTIDVAASTNSVLGGLALGLGAGALAIVVLPLVYFGIGWVIGFVQGIVLNFLIEASGGIELDLHDNKNTKKTK